MPQSTNLLLIIDPQNDFCDLPPEWLPADPLVPGASLHPALPVAGAHADLLRVAGFIEAAGTALTDIAITLDSHQHLDIGHPTFWQTSNGAAVAPFTQISAGQVRAGAYIPRDAARRERVQNYLEALEAAGRYTHMVWPLHCEIGAWGHNVHYAVRAACNRWEEQMLRNVYRIIKGTNPLTEHYSALCAEVPDPQDAATGLNRELLAWLRTGDRVFIAGEAGSHCVKATVEHIVEQFSAQERGRLVLLSDCMSAVTGFESHYHDFLAAMQTQGLSLASAAQAGAMLRQARTE